MVKQVTSLAEILRVTYLGLICLQVWALGYSGWGRLGCGIERHKNVSSLKLFLIFRDPETVTILRNL